MESTNPKPGRNNPQRIYASIMMSNRDDGFYQDRLRTNLKKPDWIGGRSHLYIKTNILPRQARDKHKETTQKRDRIAGRSLSLSKRTAGCLPNTLLVLSLPLRLSRACLGKVNMVCFHEKIYIYISLYIYAIASHRNCSNVRILLFLSILLSAPIRFGWLGWVDDLRKTVASFFECFSYVCPEPVLVKRSF